MNAETSADEVVCVLRNGGTIYNEEAADLIEQQAAEIERLETALAASRRREKAAVEDLQAFVKYPCGVCAHLQDQRFCYLNCQNHDRENHRAWQWRGPSDREVHHDA